MIPLTRTLHIISHVSTPHISPPHSQRRRAAIHLAPNERAALGEAHRLSMPLVPLRVPLPALTATTVTNGASAVKTQSSPYSEDPRSGNSASGKINSGRRKSQHRRTSSLHRMSSTTEDIVSELFMAEVAGAIATGSFLAATSTAKSISASTTPDSMPATDKATGAVTGEANHAVVFYIPSVADALRMRAGKAPQGLMRRRQVHVKQDMHKAREEGVDGDRMRGAHDGASQEEENVLYVVSLPCVTKKHHIIR